MINRSFDNLSRDNFDLGVTIATKFANELPSYVEIPAVSVWFKL